MILKLPWLCFFYVVLVITNCRFIVGTENIKYTILNYKCNNSNKQINSISFSFNPSDQTEYFAYNEDLTKASPPKILFKKKPNGEFIQEYNTDMQKINDTELLTALSSIYYLCRGIDFTSIKDCAVFDIPQEINIKIMSHLKISELTTMCCVSKNFNKIIKSVFYSLKENKKYMIDIINQIFENYTITSMQIFRIPHFILPSNVLKNFFYLPIFCKNDITWAINLFMNGTETSEFLLEQNAVKYDPPKNCWITEQLQIHYRELVDACLPKHVARLASKYYNSIKYASRLNWHINNTKNNPTEQKQWINGKNISVTIFNKEYQVSGVVSYNDGVVSYTTCFKWLWDVATAYQNELNYTFYQQPSILLCLLKILKQDFEDGIINKQDLKKYITYIKNFYKNILPKQPLEAKTNQCIDQSYIDQLIEQIKNQVPAEDLAIIDPLSTKTSPTNITPPSKSIIQPSQKTLQEPKKTPKVIDLPSNFSTDSAIISPSNAHIDQAVVAKNNQKVNPTKQSEGFDTLNSYNSEKNTEKQLREEIKTLEQDYKITLKRFDGVLNEQNSIIEQLKKDGIIKDSKIESDSKIIKSYISANMQLFKEKEKQKLQLQLKTYALKTQMLESKLDQLRIKLAEANSNHEQSVIATKKVEKELKQKEDELAKEKTNSEYAINLLQDENKNQADKLSEMEAQNLADKEKITKQGLQIQQVTQDKDTLIENHTVSTNNLINQHTMTKKKLYYIIAGSVLLNIVLLFGICQYMYFLKYA